MTVVACTGRVFGGRRSRSGEYTVSIDNQDPRTFPPYAGSTDEFQQVLFGAPDLPWAWHQIRITNTGATTATQSTLDIDYVRLDIPPPTLTGCSQLTSNVHIARV